MIYLHLSVLEGVPCLWAEQDAPQKGSPDRTETESTYLLQDLSIKELRRVLKPHLPELKILKSNTVSAFVWLPSRGGSPILYRPLAQPSQDRRYKIHLKPFEIKAIALNSMDVAELSRLAGSKQHLEGGIILGPSILWMSRSFNNVLNMAISEQFLPGLEYKEDNWQARWIPLPDQEQEKELKSLSDSMPGVIRSISTSAEEPPQTDPQQLTSQFVSRLLDSMIRIAHSSGISSKRKSFPSIHDAWLSALSTPDPVVNWKGKELQELKDQLAQWQRTTRITRESPFTFCLRLSEPEKGRGDTGWKVDYLLQPKSDPTLQLPLSELWDHSGSAFQELSRYGGNISEYVLIVLGQAARLCPDINKSLRQREPSGFELDGEGALEFLTQYADLLKGAGFHLLLPSWWTGQGPASRAGIKVKVKTPSMQGSSGLTMDSLFNFDYQYSLNGEAISLEELEELARLKTPLVRLKGQWTYMTSDSIKTAIKFLRKQKEGKITGRELLRMSLGGEGEIEGLPVEQIESEEWLGNILEKLVNPGGIRAGKEPDGFSGNLRPYQKKGLAWLSFLQGVGLGACLADDMGLGKTIQTLALVQQQREFGEDRPVLLICPTSVVNNWQKEAEKFTPQLRVMVHHGSDRRKKSNFCNVAESHDLVISSYGLLVRDVDFLQKVQWSGLVLDEAQNIKNHETKRARTSRSIVADYRIALTGTPVENHVGDLWSIMDFLNPGLLGNQTSFKNRFYKPIQLWKNEDAASRLKELTSPFILRRLKTDKKIISDLPEKIETKEYCILTKEQITLYKAVLNEMEEKIHGSEGIDRKGMILSALTRLKQICNHPAQFSGDKEQLLERSGKLTRLLEMLEEVRNLGEGSLIFTQYAEMGQILKKCLQEEFLEDVFFLSGSVSRKKRDEMVRAFQEDPDAPKIFILSLKAGGTGLNLSRANHVFHYDRWWNPAVENQATDRAFRIGQKKNVQVHKFLVAGTLEDRIDQMIENKSSLADKVVGKGDAGLTEMSDEQVKELLKLGREATGD